MNSEFLAFIKTIFKSSPTVIQNRMLSKSSKISKTIFKANHVTLVNKISFIFYLLIPSLILIPSQILSQSTFGYYYTDVPNGNSLAFPVLTRLPDGSIIGTNSYNGVTDFSLFRMDSSGNILWKKKISANSLQIQAPYSIVLLKDSTLAILTKLYLTPGFCIIKCDFSGNIIWANQYTGISFFSAQVTPAENGSLVLTEMENIIFINPDGTIKFAYDLPLNLTGWESIYKGNDGVTILATDGNDIFLFDMDTLGVISNNYKYTLVGTLPVSINYIPSENMVKSPTGGSFVFLGRGSSLIKFNDQNQLIWAKKISVASPSNIVGTADGGCITSSFVDSTSTNKQPLYCKFDSTGNLEWTKAPVDLINPGVVYTTAIITDGNSGWYSAMQRNKLQINHIDSAFNGFCSYQNIVPAVDTLQVINNGFTVSFSSINLIENPLPVSSVPVGWYRYDSCSGVLIDSTTGIGENIQSEIKILLYPNPVASMLTVSLSQEFVSYTITLFNSVGEKIEEQNITNKAEHKINLEKYNPGLYLIRIQSETWFFTERIIKN